MKHINPGEQFRIPMDAVEDDVEKSGNKRLKTIWEKIQQEQDVDAMEYMSLAYIYGKQRPSGEFGKGDWIFCIWQHRVAARRHSTTWRIATPMELA